MDGSLFFGLFTIISLICLALGGKNGMELFINIEAAILVLGGTLAISFIHFPITQIIRVWRRLIVALSFRKINLKNDIKFIVSLSSLVKQSGIQAIIEPIDKHNDHFTKTGFQLLIDNVPLKELEPMLVTNLNLIERRHHLGIHFFDQLAKYAPAFGLLGTTIGLIQLLSNLQNPATIGQGMAIALVSTFYGILLANVVFTPISGRLKTTSIEEQLQKEMIMTGILAIANHDPTPIVEEKMMIFLTKKERSSET